MVRFVSHSSISAALHVSALIAHKVASHLRLDSCLAHRADSDFAAPLRYRVVWLFFFAIFAHYVTSYCAIKYHVTTP